MGRTSAGLLLYRRRPDGVEVLLAHPGGPFWAKRDEGSWSIPKGEIEGDEVPLAAARREFEEETGYGPVGEFLSLGAVRQAAGKTVHAWAVEGDLDPRGFVSDTFEMEWPPRSGRWQEFAEIDRLEFFDLVEARVKLNPAQAEFVDRLEDLLRGGDSGTP